MKKYISIILVFLIILSACQNNKEEKKIDNRPYVSIAEVEKNMFKEEFQTSGTIKGTKEVEIYSKVSGKLIEYKVPEGKWVKKDQVIALIDRDITGLDYKPAPVKSPISGVLSKNYLDRGTMVMPGQISIARVSNMSTVKIDMDLPEKYFSKIKKNLKVTVTVDSYPEKTFEGIINNYSPIIDNVTHTVSAEVVISNPNLLLRSGMFARIYLLFEKSQRKSIPQGALYGDNYVYTYKDGVVHINKVETGLISDKYIEIKKGLELGEKIVTIGQKFLKDNMKVKVR